MIVEIGTALLVGVIGTMAIGTIVKGKLGFRSAVNWAVQTAVLAAVVFVAPWPTELQAWIIVLFPTFVHLLVQMMKLVLLFRVKRGAYGDATKWAYELYNEGDEEFIRAQQSMSKNDAIAMKELADSKEELREMVVEEHESGRNL